MNALVAFPLCASALGHATVHSPARYSLKSLLLRIKKSTVRWAFLYGETDGKPERRRRVICVDRVTRYHVKAQGIGIFKGFATIFGVLKTFLKKVKNSLAIHKNGC